MPWCDRFWMMPIPVSRQECTDFCKGVCGGVCICDPCDVCDMEHSVPWKGHTQEYCAVDCVEINARETYKYYCKDATCSGWPCCMCDEELENPVVVMTGPVVTANVCPT